MVIFWRAMPCVASCSIARKDFGDVLGLDGLVNTGSDSDFYFHPLKPALTLPMYIIWKKYQVFRPVAFLLLDELKKIFGSDGGKNSCQFMS